MKRYRAVMLAVLVAVAAVVATSATGMTKGSALQTQCAATFHVQHDDRIGSLQLPEGTYQLRPSELTCTQASLLFAEFLRDYGGQLPRPWRYTVNGVGDGTFQRGVGQARFQAVRAGDVTPGTPGHVSDGGGSHGDLSCGFFQVRHNDRIGPLRLREGRYLVSSLGARLSCGAAINLFRQFLNRPRGNLPDGWVVMGPTGEFLLNSTRYGFYVKRMP